MEKLPIGTKVKFTKKLIDAATGDHPAFLLANKGETGYIVGHREKGYSAVAGVFENNPYGSFILEDGEFETCEG